MSLPEILWVGHHLTPPRTNVANEWLFSCFFHPFASASAPHCQFSSTELTQQASALRRQMLAQQN